MASADLFAVDFVPLSSGERELLAHVGMWGSDGYPVRRIGRGWTWGPAFGVQGPPTVVSTKREAIALFEAWLERARERSGAESFTRAIAERRARGMTDEQISAEIAAARASS